MYVNGLARTEVKTSFSNAQWEPMSQMGPNSVIRLCRLDVRFARKRTRLNVQRA